MTEKEGQPIMEETQQECQTTLTTTMATKDEPTPIFLPDLKSDPGPKEEHMKQYDNNTEDLVQQSQQHPIVDPPTTGKVPNRFKLH